MRKFLQHFLFSLCVEVIGESGKDNLQEVLTLTLTINLLSPDSQKIVEVKIHIY